MKLYGIKSCDTVRKARKYLDEANISYTFVDMDETPIDASDIKRWLNTVDIGILFNTRSTAYRTLGLKERIRNDHDKIRWMAKENRLIKRPVLETPEKVIVGFSRDHYHQLAKD